jgi:hypothetical protein
MSNWEWSIALMGPVGGTFHDGSKFGADAVEPNFSLILISE